MCQVMSSIELQSGGVKSIERRRDPAGQGCVSGQQPALDRQAAHRSLDNQLQVVQIRNRLRHMNFVTKCMIVPHLPVGPMRARTPFGCKGFAVDDFRPASPVDDIAQPVSYTHLTLPTIYSV